MHDWNLQFSYHSENNWLVKTKCENQFQYFKLCEIKFIVFSVPHNFDIDEAADEDQQIELIKCDSVLK